MAFKWLQKNQLCRDCSGNVISCFAAPLAVKQNQNNVWLFNRSTLNGHIDTFRNGERQHVLQYIRSTDSPGGAASRDGRTMLLVYRGFWSNRLLWSLWTESSGWHGNYVIQGVETNGRGAAVAFFKDKYWVFYVNEKRRLCSVSFNEIDSTHYLPVWSSECMYADTCVLDGRPCCVVAEQKLYVCYCNDCGGVSLLTIKGASRRHKVITLKSQLDCYSWSGTPTLAYYGGFLHLFIRDRRHSVLCWYIKQYKGRWVSATDACVLDIRSRHGCSAYENEKHQLVLLCSTHGNIFDEMLQGSHAALRQNILQFETVNKVYNVSV